jgi:hypothetical protein
VRSYQHFAEMVGALRAPTFSVRIHGAFSRECEVSGSFEVSLILEVSRIGSLDIGVARVRPEAGYNKLLPKVGGNSGGRGGGFINRRSLVWGPSRREPTMSHSARERTEPGFVFCAKIGAELKSRFCTRSTTRGLRDAFVCSLVFSCPTPHSPLTGRLAWEFKL